MDFIMGLLRSLRGHDTVWVVVNRLTKSAYFGGHVSGMRTCFRGIIGGSSTLGRVRIQ